ncbi:MAG: hypothetical protein ACE5QF_02430 [Thermoplasmata archaeon]
MRTILCLGQVPPEPPRPREDWQLFIAVLAIAIVMAFVSLLVLAVLILPRGMIVDHKSEPTVQLTGPQDLGGNQWEVKVAGVSEVKRLDNFMVLLLENGTVVDDINPLSEQHSTYLTFTDLDGAGSLTTGDFFTITCPHSSGYRLSIVWRDSASERGRVEWET